MPESKSEQVRHSNEEISNFLLCGDARGPAWLAHHPADAERALWTVQGREAGVAFALADFEVTNRIQ